MTVSNIHPIFLTIGELDDPVATIKKQHLSSECEKEEHQGHKHKNADTLRRPRALQKPAPMLLAGKRRLLDPSRGEPYGTLAGRNIDLTHRTSSATSIGSPNLVDINTRLYPDSCYQVNDSRQRQWRLMGRWRLRHTLLFSSFSPFRSPQ